MLKIGIRNHKEEKIFDKLSDIEKIKFVGRLYILITLAYIFDDNNLNGVEYTELMQNSLENKEMYDTLNMYCSVLEDKDADKEIIENILKNKESKE